MSQPRPDPYCGPAPAPADLLTTWNGDAILMGAMALLALALWVEARRSGQRPAAGVAMAAAAVAFLSPLCAGTVALFSVRSVHHIVVALILAPALAQVLARRALPALPGLAPASMAFAVAMTVWHLPRAYAAAWDSHAVYWLMQGALLATAVLCWHRILRALAQPQSALPAALNLAALSGVMGLIGAVLTFSPQLLFIEHLAIAPAYGLDPLTDQQLAGLIMWVPGALPLALIAANRLARGLLGVQSA